jgi:hypothetical protein
MLLGFFATLLLLVVAAQVWIGIALTFDHEGPLTRFKTPTKHDDSPEPSSATPDDAPAPPTAPESIPTTAPATGPTAPPA